LLTFERIIDADGGRFGYGGKIQQNLLDLGWSNTFAGDLQRVVGAAENE
jgi:hypothetical protein